MEKTSNVTANRTPKIMARMCPVGKKRMYIVFILLSHTQSFSKERITSTFHIMSHAKCKDLFQKCIQKYLHVTILGLKSNSAILFYCNIYLSIENETMLAL